MVAGYIVGATLVLAVPGPSVLFAVTRTLAWGMGPGLMTMLGLEAGLITHLLGAVLGLSALVASTPVLLQALRILGAGYLLLLAARGLRRNGPSVAAQPVGAIIPPGWSLVRSGWLVDVLNPKTGLFFLAFLPQFVAPGRGDVIAQLLVLGGCTVVLAVGCDSCWVLLAALTRHARDRSGSDPMARSRGFSLLSSSAYAGLALLVLAG